MPGTHQSVPSLMASTSSSTPSTSSSTRSGQPISLTAIQLTGAPERFGRLLGAVREGTFTYRRVKP